MSRTRRNRRVSNRLIDFYDTAVLTKDKDVSKTSVNRKLSMKPYTLNRKQFWVLNICKNKLEFDNANRRFKKSVRQHSKQEILNELKNE